MSAPRIALTGGTGFVGSMLIDLAMQCGIEIMALARSDQPLRQGVTWVKGDLANREALARMMNGAEAVIHVAGVVSARAPADFTQGNVAGTQALINAARAGGVPRMVFVSSLSAREPDLSAYGASKARAEQLVRDSGLDWSIVRPPGIYGPRDREMFELFRAAKWGVVPVPAGGSASLIHVEDLARLLLALIPGGEDVTNRLFEPDDGEPGGWAHPAMARAIGRAVGRRVLVIGLPPRVLRWAAWVDGRLRGAQAKLTPDRARYMAHPDWVVSAGAAVPASLWRPRIGTREGLRTTAEWYASAGW